MGWKQDVWNEEFEKTSNEIKDKKRTKETEKIKRNARFRAKLKYDKMGLLKHIKDKWVESPLRKDLAERFKNVNEYLINEEKK